MNSVSSLPAALPAEAAQQGATMPLSSVHRKLRFFLPVLTLAAGATLAAGILTCLPATAQERPAAPVIAPRHIYSETADPKADIAAALTRARREHKRVILDFGGDWCPDCQVLDIYLRQPANAALLDQHFVLVHVWIGQMDQNIALAAKYGVPIAKGVPALAVLAPDGRPVYSQQTGQFNDMRHMESASVTGFLERWKG